MEIPEPTNLVLAVMGGTLFGLLSLPHCLGMCGPLHLAVCLSDGKRPLRALSTFNLGRIAGYTAIGFLCGLFGAQLTEFAAHDPAPQAEVSALDAPMRGGGTEEGAAGHEKNLWRRALMFLFPAAILLLSGAKALRKKPGVVGERPPGLFGLLFRKSRRGGPVTLGFAASLLPCGMLYYAFAVALSTLSPILGASFLFVYCLTISFFMQLGILASTTFSGKLGPRVDRALPWLALAGSGVYITLFFVR